MVYDFLPAEPTAPATAATLLSGRSVKGVVRQRAMRRVPPRRCTWIGTAAVGNVSPAPLKLTLGLGTKTQAMLGHRYIISLNLLKPLRICRERRAVFHVMHFVVTARREI